MTGIIYFSNVSENTHRFVQKLGRPAVRMPVRAHDTPVVAEEDYVLITPTYGGGVGTKAVPRQVVSFLKHPDNIKHLTGVVASGNKNFGLEYCLAGRQIALRFNVPLIHCFEILGLEEDLVAVSNHLDRTETP